LRRCICSDVRCISGPPDESHDHTASELGTGKPEARNLRHGKVPVTYVAFVIGYRPALGALRCLREQASVCNGGSGDVFLAGVVDVGLLGDELGGVGESLLGVGVEAGGAAGAGVVADAGGVERAA